MIPKRGVFPRILQSGPIAPHYVHFFEKFSPLRSVMHSFKHLSVFETVTNNGIATGLFGPKPNAKFKRKKLCLNNTQPA